MMTKRFGMGLFNHKLFNIDSRREFKTKWDSMNDSEKLAFVNKLIERFDERDSDGEEDRFSVEAMNARCEAWAKMTPVEKQAFVIEHKEDFEHKMEHMHHHMHNKHFAEEFKVKWDGMNDSEKLDFANRHMERFGEDHFSVEAMDARCEAWTKMTADEKQAFVAKRKECFEHKMQRKQSHEHGHHKHFAEELKAKWEGMNDSEKLDFANKHMERFGEDRFSVEAMDARCEAWTQMSPDEKQAFVAKRKECFEHKKEHMHHRHHRHGFFGHMF